MTEHCAFVLQNGDSPLHIASAMGRRKLVRILLESPLIDLQLKNQQNETALEIGTRKNHQEIVAMIRHPPTVKKTEAMVSVKAEINMTHESEESKHHHKKVIAILFLAKFFVQFSHQQ